MLSVLFQAFTHIIVREAMFLLSFFRCLCLLFIMCMLSSEVCGLLSPFERLPCLLQLLGAVLTEHSGECCIFVHENNLLRF